MAHTHDLNKPDNFGISTSNCLGSIMMELVQNVHGEAHLALILTGDEVLSALTIAGCAC